MAKVLVTGRAGSGKTTVVHELLKRGYSAFDTDEVPLLSSWVNKTTGKAVTLEDCSVVDNKLYVWLWSPALLEEFIQGHKNLFICGGADNDYDFDTLFDYHFVLDVSPQIQSERVKHRTNNTYGKGMIPVVIDDQKNHIAKARQQKSILINADQPIVRVVDDILRQIS